MRRSIYQDHFGIVAFRWVDSADMGSCEAELTYSTGLWRKRAEKHLVFGYSDTWRWSDTGLMCGAGLRLFLSAKWALLDRERDKIERARSGKYEVR